MPFQILLHFIISAAFFHFQLRRVFGGQANITHYEYYYEDYAQGLDEVIDKMNEYLYELLGINEDIRTFEATLIEFCFNVRTNNVEEYIQMFNLIFSWRDPAKYINYVEEEEKPQYSSFYVRSNKNYEKDSKAGVTANFYNKADETRYRIAESLQKAYETMRKVALGLQQPSEDVKPELPHQLLYQRITENILRLEVITGRQGLYRTRKKHNIGKALSEYTNPMLCKEEVVRRYRHLIGNENLSFYSYQKAKEKIENSNLGREKKQNLIQYIRYHNGACSRKKDDKKAERRRLELAGLGIHWCLIPTNYGIDCLESPINLLEWQHRNMDDVERKRELRVSVARVEVDMINSITEEDDGAVIIVECGEGE